MSDIMSAVKRLERAGAENSRATKKLHESVRRVAALIEESCPNNVTLPRGYRVVNIKSNIGNGDFLVTSAPGEYGEEVVYIDGYGGYFHGDFNCWIPGQTRSVSLQFAKDVAEGLLDEIGDFLEARQQKTDRAAEGFLQHLPAA